MNRLHLLILLPIAVLLTNSADAEPFRPGPPIVYEPFYPDIWKQKGQDTTMYPWEGNDVVLLTTTADLDGTVMRRFVARLDAGWALFKQITGVTPRLKRQHNGKATIAAVPDPSFIKAYGLGFIGLTGIEVAGFYRADYDLVRDRPNAFPGYYFYEMGRNFFTYGDRHNAFTTGFAVFMRHVCMETLQLEYESRDKRNVVDMVEGELATTELSFLKAFTLAGGLAPGEQRVPGLNPSNHHVVYASAMLRMWNDYGGNEWAKRFYGYIQQCPQFDKDTKQGAESQCLMLMLSASCAARHDLSELFANRWRMSLDQRFVEMMRDIDWEAGDCSPMSLVGRVPLGALPIDIAMKLPTFLGRFSEEDNLVEDGSFEVQKWKPQERARVVDSVHASEGKRLLAIVSDEKRHITYPIQKTTLQPNSRYLLCGWVKSKDVKTNWGGFGNNGAALCISSEPTFWTTPTVYGTNDWRYVCLIFDTLDRTDWRLTAKLGYFSRSFASGIAGFDDVRLYKLSQ